MKLIENKNYPLERDLYAARDLHLKHCSFDGVEDGESALKEARNIILEDCYMNLRYPIWHVEHVELKNVEMTEQCRAALWYTKNIIIEDSKLLGIKALRECSDIEIKSSIISSPEFGWRSRFIELIDTKIISEYLFFEASNLELLNVEFSGKYSFQYVENMKIKDSHFKTKDAFWHSKDVVVEDSIIEGEYLGWYSENLTFIRCKIIGTQPLCYCKNLKLIDCTMENTDLSFEYSHVTAKIDSTILSVKNPASGRIEAKGIEELILTKDSVYENHCEIVISE